MNYRILLYMLLIVCLSSCSFNSLYFLPLKLSSEDKKEPAAWRGDTTIIHFVGDSFQPSFTDMNDMQKDFGIKVESVLFQDKLGHKLNGWFVKSSIDTNTPKATILCLHGNAGNIGNRFFSFTPLVKYGYQLFLFDYSGFGFSEGEATQKNVIMDALAALDYIKTRKEVAHTKLVIYGQSLGGHLAAALAAKRESDIDGLVIEGAFSSHKDIAAYFTRQLFMPGFFARMVVKSAYNGSREIRKFHNPVLVIHSTEDPLIPFYMGKKIYANANSPKDFFQIDGCHVCGPRIYPAEISEKMNKLFHLTNP